jgi:general stress protein 26
MSSVSLESIAQKMRYLDIAMFTTVDVAGNLNARPMSNNADVEYDGNSYYFTTEQTGLVSEVTHHPQVGLGFEGDDGLYVHVAGTAELIRDKAEFAAHWTKDLDRWFERGIDTEGLILIKVHATRIHYWDGEENGELVL